MINNHLTNKEFMKVHGEPLPGETIYGERYKDEPPKLTEEIIWHSTTDKMPEKDQRIRLLMATFGGRTFGGYWDGEYWVNDTGHLEASIITHWAKWPQHPRTLA